MAAAPLRLLVYDRTLRGPPLLPGLSHTFAAGAKLWGALDRLDASFGAASWREALEWLATVEPGRPIAELQFWGHGRFGQALIGGDTLDHLALLPSDPRHALLLPVRARLLDGGRALWWFRTCETFATERGHEFARAWSRFFGCRVAGHTYVIWVAQSGCHVLEPGAEPHWPLDEGLKRPPRADDDPAPRARWSGLFQPGTVSFLGNQVPKRYRLPPKR